MYLCAYKYHGGTQGTFLPSVLDKVSIIFQFWERSQILQTQNQNSKGVSDTFATLALNVSLCLYHGGTQRTFLPSVFDKVSYLGEPLNEENYSLDTNF